MDIIQKLTLDRKKVILRKIPSLKNLHWLWLWQGISSPSDCHLFTALNQNLGAQRFTDDRDVTDDTMADNTAQGMTSTG
jgi:hypothetical protein